MHLPRVCFPVLTVLLAAVLPAAAQSVVSTRAGVVHYFEGAVSIGGVALHPQFGRFPEIAEGAELRTAAGRAEVLLGPGAILRIAENSAVQMISSSLADTRVGMVCGSAILESKDTLPGNSIALLYKEWQIRIPKQGVYRIDTDPSQIRVYDGAVEVQSAQSAPVTVRAGQTLSLSSILISQETVGDPGDEFNTWAFERSEAIAADNATAEQITDDPALYPDMATAGGLSYAGYTYFPATMGYPYIGYGMYGAWTPAIGYYGYGSSASYIFRALHPGSTIGAAPSPLRLHFPTVGTYHPIGGLPTSHPGIHLPSMPHSAPVAHPVGHVGHR